MTEQVAGQTSLPSLPEAVHPLIRQLESGEFLGASRNIRQINDLFVGIVEAWPSPSAEELRATLQATGDYFIATRGRNTPAIANGVRLLLKGLYTMPSPTVDEVRQFIL